MLAVTFTPAGDISLRHFYGSFNATNTTTGVFRIINLTDCNTGTFSDGTMKCYNIQGSAMINVTNESTSVNNTIIVTFNNQSLENLDIRQRADNTSLTTLANSKATNAPHVDTVNTLTGNVTLRGSQFINLTGNSTDILFTWNNFTLSAFDARVILFNASATALNTRQSADNTSVARTNVQNFFTTGQNITGLVNATSLQVYNITMNVTGEYWMQGSTCRYRKFHNGTHMIETGTC